VREQANLRGDEDDAEGASGKEIGEELVVDIERYKGIPALVGLVYDPDKMIQNRRALEADQSRKTDGLVVRVYTPRIDLNR
jgi:hypothetical protein